MSVPRDVQLWSRLRNQCLRRRVPANQFEEFATVLINDAPVSGAKLAQIFLGSEPGSDDRSSTFLDPLVSIYVEILLRKGYVYPADILAALLEQSRFRRSNDHQSSSDSSSANSSSNRHFCVELAEMLFLDLARLFVTAERPKGRREVLDLLKVLSTWMSAVAAAGTTDILKSVTEQDMVESRVMTEAVGMLTTAVVENAKVANIVTGSNPKGIKAALTQALSPFISHISPTSPAIAARLESFRRTNHLYEKADMDVDKALSRVETGQLQLDGLGGLTTVEGPIVHSRAGLYIFLQALLVGRPAVDDTIILNHLIARYKGEISTAMTELIIASFDIVSNATFRSESRQTLFLLQSFLINHVPLLLTTLSMSLYPPITPEYCIVRALNHIDIQAFPSLSSIFPDTSIDSSLFSDVRQDFLFACCLHGLIPEASIGPLLGEPPMQELPPGGRYTKELLLQQCATDHGRVERLLEEIEGTDGNAGAVVEAIVELIRNMCVTKETILLKTISISLARRPSSLDVMLCFSTPAAILHPICELLDGWRYGDDQGEHQPVYEEFGCILLLVLAFIHRYDLDALDLGVTDRDSFIAKLLRPVDPRRWVDEMSDEESKRLTGWMRGLFDPEQGISDELMSSCRPQDFYFMVPALFQLSLLACHMEAMTMETLKEGLEYMLETFLLPSLVQVIPWLINHTWEWQGDIESIMQVFHVLIRPKSISGEAEIVHRVVLSIIGKPLEICLKQVRRKEPSPPPPAGSGGFTRSEIIDRILQVLQGPHHHLTFQRTTNSHHTELESWTTTARGGMLASIRNTFQSLVLWSTAPDINMTPASYTHRQLLTALRLLGAIPVMRTIVDELKLQSQNESGDLALDIACSLVCAPRLEEIPIVVVDVASTTADNDDDHHHHNTLTGGRGTATRQLYHRPKGRITLRDALRLEYDDVQKPSSSSSSSSKAATAGGGAVMSGSVTSISNTMKTNTTDPARAESVGRLYRRVEGYYAAMSAHATAAAATAVAVEAAVAAVSGATVVGLDGVGAVGVDSSGGSGGGGGEGDGSGNGGGSGTRALEDEVVRAGIDVAIASVAGDLGSVEEMGEMVLTTTDGVTDDPTTTTDMDTHHHRYHHLLMQQLDANVVANVAAAAAVTVAAGTNVNVNNPNGGHTTGLGGTNPGALNLGIGGGADDLGGSDTSAGDLHLNGMDPLSLGLTLGIDPAHHVDGRHDDDDDDNHHHHHHQEVGFTSSIGAGTIGPNLIDSHTGLGLDLGGLGDDGGGGSNDNNNNNNNNNRDGFMINLDLALAPNGPTTTTTTTTTSSEGEDIYFE